MSRSESGLSPAPLRTVGLPAGSNGPESEGTNAAGWGQEADAAWLAQDAGFIAELNRTKSLRRERLRADVRSLASRAMATLRELVTGPDVPPAVRLRACLAILQAADALAVEEIGPTSAESVQAKLDRQRFLESLGG